MVHKRIVHVDGYQVVVDPQHDMYYGSGKSRIYTHYILGAAEGRDALNYKLDGPYPVGMYISNYKILIQECVEKYGISTVLRRVPSRAKKIVMRGVDELIEERRVN